MNVRLAAQVLSSTVSNVLREFAPSYTAGTSKYCEYINHFFDCLNIRVPNAIEIIEDGKLVNKKMGRLLTRRGIHLWNHISI